MFGARSRRKLLQKLLDTIEAFHRKEIVYQQQIYNLETENQQLKIKVSHLQNLLE
jgi:hypothetical protein